LGVGFIFRLVILAGILRLGFLTGLFTIHRDGEPDIIAVFLYQARQRVFVKIFAVLFVVGILFEDQNDLGADIFLFSLRQRISFYALRFPLPGSVLPLSTGDNRNFAGYHKSGVETDAKLADDVNVIALVFSLEVQ